MAKKKGMPKEIVLIRIKTGQKKIVPFETALTLLKGQVGKHINKHHHKIGEGYKFNGTDIIRVKEEITHISKTYILFLSIPSVSLFIYFLQHVIPAFVSYPVNRKVGSNIFYFYNH